MENKQNHNRIAAITDRSPMTVIACKATNDRDIELVTSNISNLTGYSADEFMSGKLQYLELVHNSDIRRVRNEIAYYKDLPECTNFTHAPYRIHHRLGHDVWIEDHTQIVRDSNGVAQKFEGIIFDCTLRVMAEQALHEREKYVNEIEVISGVASGEYFPEIGRFYSSPNLDQLLNTQECDQNQTFQSIEAAIHPDDLVKVQNKHLQFQEGMFPYSVTYRVTSHDGEIRTIQERVKIEIEEYHEHRALFTFLDITDLEKSRNEAKSSKQDYYTLFEYAPIPLWQENVAAVFERFKYLKQNGVTDISEFFAQHPDEFAHLVSLTKIKNVNNAALKLHNAKSKDALINHLEDYISTRSNIGLQFLLTSLFTGKTEGTIVTEVLTASKEARQVMLSFHIMDPQKYTDDRDMIISTVDISRRVKAEEQVSMLTTAIEQNPVTIVITDLEGNIEYVNPTFTRITGYSYDEVIGKNPRFLKSGEQDDQFYNDMWAHLSSGKEWHCIMKNKCKDGSYIWEEVALAPIRDNDGTIIRYLAVKEDITKKRALEEQFRQSQKMGSIGRLASGIAHDFNNILTVITGYAELLHSEVGESGEFLDDILEIEEASAQAARLARQLLEFSRKDGVTSEKIIIGETLTKMSKMLHRVVPENIKLSVDIKDKNCIVEADSSQIEQLFMNLIVNSIDAIGREKAGNISILADSINLEETLVVGEKNLVPGNYCKIVLTDDGCGISDTVLEKMFDPFFTTKDKGKGTGLGMATVSDILHQYGAKIEVVSSTGNGSTFTIYWPRDSYDEEKVELCSDTPLSGTESILFVEDDLRIRSMVTQRLHSLGYTVKVAGTGDEAILLLNKPNTKIDLVLTDVVMPGKGGFELGTYILDNFPDLPVIYSSGYVDTIIPDHLMAKCRDNYVQKPYSITVLTNKIRHCLDCNEECVNTQ